MELVDRVYLTIRKMIFDQKLKVGQKLIQEKLAAELGVSRSPLLKALQRLESELLVENIPRRGIYVKSMSLEEIVDVYQCRAVLEGLSARLAATLITREQINTLTALFKPFEKASSIDPEAYAEADRSFHSLIMKWSDNALMLRLEVLSSIHLKAYQAGLLRPPEETLPEHFAIIDALAKQDGHIAEQLMRRHVERSLENLMNQQNQ